MLPQRLMFGGLALVVILAPLPLGSNRDWSWNPVAVVVGGLLVAQALVALLGDVDLYRAFRALQVPALLVVVVVVWAGVQISGWSPLSWENPIRAASAPFLPMASHLVAIEREEVVTGLIRLLTYVGVFVLAAGLTSDSRDARRLYAVVVCSAVAYTLYSMVAEVANRMSVNTGIRLPVAFEDSFSGPFINRNNYATYAAIAALAAATLATSSVRRGRYASDEESLGERWRRRIAASTGAGGLWLVATIVLVLGVLLSGSRAGWASLAIGLVVMIALQARGWSRWSAGVAIVLALAAVALLVPGGNTLLIRAALLVEQGEANREQLSSITVGAIALRPMLGWGMNSFRSLYSLFQPTTLSSPFDKAHNTYLELAFDLGVPVAAALVLAVVWIGVRCLSGLSERRQDRELTALGVGASITVGIHALFDFSLQIPGVTIVFAALLGAAWAQSWSSRRIYF